MKNKFLNINKFTDKYIYEKHLIYVLIFFMSLMMPTIFLLYKGEMWDVSKTLIYSIETILGIVNLDLIIFNLIKRECKLEHVFLNLMIPVGCCYLVLIIPNYVYDEAAHSYRAYVISEGHIITDRQSDNKPKMEVPKDLIDSINVHTYKQLVEAINKKTDYNNLVLVGDDGVGATGYPFVCYIFSSIGMLIGRILNLNIIIAYYLAKILSFISFLILSFYTLKKLPIGKIIMFVYLFNPMLIQQCTSISADNIINSVSLLLVAYIFNKIFSKEKIKTKELNIIAILSILLSVMKYVYFPLILFILLLIKNNPEKKKKILLIILISGILTVLTYLSVNSMYATSNSYMLDNGISSTEQIKFILTHPFQYLKVLIYTTIANFEFYFFTVFGRNLGNYTIQLASIIPVIYAFILAFSPFLEKHKIELKKETKISIIIIFTLIYCLIETGLYLVWTKIGANIIEGVQGRYFIPIVFLIPMLFIDKKNELHFKNRRFWISLCLLFINFLAVYRIFKYFNY